MPALKRETEFGESVPPVNNYAITTNMPGWDLVVGFREGDKSGLAKIQYIYPRFGPWRGVRTVWKSDQRNPHSYPSHPQRRGRLEIFPFFFYALPPRN